MYELIQAGENTYYINCPAKIGVYRTGQGVCLIDSGNDRSAGKKVLKILEQNGWDLLAVLNTHSHADHTGGNRYLQSQTGCKIFACGAEAAFASSPILEPSLLYGGCPPKDLRHKFLMAQESQVSPLSSPDFPRELEVIPLPGHCLEMVGFRTPDQVVFLADCLASRAALDKYALTYLYDVEASLQTLDRVEAMEAALFVPAHAEAVGSVADLVRYNREKIHAAAAALLEICREPAGFDSILQQVFRRYGLTMTFEQHALVGSTVRSYLAWLRNSGRLEAEIQNDMLLWRTC